MVALTDKHSPSELSEERGPFVWGVGQVADVALGRGLAWCHGLSTVSSAWVNC